MDRTLISFTIYSIHY